MRIAVSSLTRTLVTLVISGCFGGTGSGLVGIAGGTGGNNKPPVLAFFVQPNSATVGQIITPPVEVVARDSLGSTDSTFSGSITISLASNPTGASLSATTVQRAVKGNASFGDLSLDKAGTYTLQASASGAAAVTSTALTITTLTGP
jgi:VCBS repeat-containing protein